jgi:hypothetical protein
MIKFPHAITNPRAMMIHSNNTFPAYLAMMNSLFFDKITFKAISDAIEGLYFLPRIFIIFTY